MKLLTILSKSSKMINNLALKLSTFVALSLVVYSSPSEEPLDDACTVTHFNKVAAAISKCNNIVINGITVPAGETLELHLKDGANLTFKGAIIFTTSEWVGPLIEVIGNNVTVNGTGATLDGQGQLIWDGWGDKGKTKAKFFKIRTTESKFINIKLLNCPHQCVSIGPATDTLLDGWEIDVSLGDQKGGHNTDGFDISNSKGITIQNSVIKNQDDCVAVNQGFNFLFKNLTCIGGHGLALSVGLKSANGFANTVSNVTFTDCTVINSANGIHIKTHSDAGTGLITDVTFCNITLSGITKYGINIEQDYEKGKGTGHPKSNIPIWRLNLDNVVGTLSGDGYGMIAYILCGSDACQDWQWSQVDIQNGKRANNYNFSPDGFNI